MRIAALDIGGTSIKSGLWEGGSLTEQRETETNAKQGGQAVIAKAVQILSDYEDIDAIGISTAGQVNAAEGSIYYANENIPGYTGVQVRRCLEEIFEVPVAVENDVNAAAIGEAAFGAGKEIKNFLMLTYGTGVGGAIMLDKKLIRGSSWSAGSFGGILIHPEDRTGERDFSGCYEKYASTTALVAAAKRVDPSLDCGRAVFEAFDRPEIQAVIDQWIDEIVYGLITLVHCFNPADLILGGGILAQEYIVEELRKRLPERVIPGFEKVKITKASLGNQAGLYGAVSLARGLIRE